MMNRPFALILPTLVGLILSPSLTWAYSPPEPPGNYVMDHAKLFDAGEIGWANASIEKMKHNSPNRALFIETVEKLADAPEEWNWGDAIRARIQDTDLKDKKKTAELFEFIGEKRIEQLDADCVYVLISMDPQYVQVSVSPGTEPFFTEENQQEIQRKFVNSLKLKNAPVTQTKARAMFNKFRKERPNYGLRRVVELTERRLAYNRPADNTAWIWSLTTLAVVGTVWLLLILVQRRLRRAEKSQAKGLRAGVEEGLPIAPLGGATGAVAGEWLFLRPRASQIGGANPQSVSTGNRDRLPTDEEELRDTRTAY